MKNNFEKELEHEKELLISENREIKDLIDPETLSVIKIDEPQNIIKKCQRNFYLKWSGIMAGIIAVLILITIIILSFMDIGFNDPLFDPAKKDPDFKADTAESNYNKTGNEDLNLSEGGAITSQGGWIYFADENEISKQNGFASNNTKIADITATQLNIIGNWLYFYEPASSSISKIRTDGKDYCVLTDKVSIKKLLASDSYIYYLDEDGHIYRLRIDGDKNYEVIIDLEILNFSVRDNVLYYISKQGDETLLSYKKLASDKTEIISETDSTTFYISGDRIYFKSNGLLTSMLLDGTKKMSVSGKNADNFIVAGNRLILFGEESYIMDADGTDIKNLTVKYDAYYSVGNEILGYNEEYYTVMEEQAWAE